MAGSGSDAGAEDVRRSERRLIAARTRCQRPTSSDIARRSASTDSPIADGSATVICRETGPGACPVAFLTTRVAV